jgi:probable F420-dependent oxidoreductase
VHFGLAFFPTDYAISPGELAAAGEERGFESLWFAEHSHIPVSRRTPFPGGGELPKMYYDTLDPFVALASAAPVTSRIKLATGICLVVQRDPIHTAKQVASLDRVSGGRFLFGVGGGWNAEEMEDHGTDFAHRFKLLRERVEAMKAIWTQDRAEYHGDLVDFDPIYSWPKPVQKPHPPVHVGGAFPGGARRAARYGDGWMPIAGFGGDVGPHIAEFRRMASEAGRDGNALEVSIFACPGNAEAVDHHREAGADRVVFAIPSEAPDKILPRLDHLAKLIG